MSRPGSVLLKALTDMSGSLELLSGTARKGGESKRGSGASGANENTESLLKLGGSGKVSNPSTAISNQEREKTGINEDNKQNLTTSGVGSGVLANLISDVIAAIGQKTLLGILMFGVVVAPQGDGALDPDIAQGLLCKVCNVNQLKFITTCCCLLLACSMECAEKVLHCPGCNSSDFAVLPVNIQPGSYQEHQPHDV